MASKWFNSLSSAQKAAYIRKHPKGAHAKGYAAKKTAEYKAGWKTLKRR